MRKLSLLTALLVGGLLFGGCVVMDFPRPQISEPSQISCADGCGGYDNGHGWDNEVMGTAGPVGYLTPLQEGEWWFSIVKMEKAQVAGCALWETAGGGTTRIDSYQNFAGADASACEPYTYLCGWNGPLNWTYSLCAPQPLTGQDHLCNVGNGQCKPGPFGYTGGVPYLWPPNSFQTNLNFVCVDQTPGAPAEFQRNIRRQPGQLCIDCGAAASQIQAPPGKTVICHIPPGNPDNKHTIIVGNAAVPAHMAHGDTMGECGGGPGPGGPGLQIPDGNFGPAWQLGEAWYADNAAYLLLGQMPYTADYFSCQNGVCGSADEAASTLMGILSKQPTNEKGFATLSISKLYGTGEPVVLNPPFEMTIKLGIQDGFLTKLFAVKPAQASFPTLVQWIINNTPDKEKVDLTKVAFGLSDGTIIYGSTIQSAFQARYALNHDELYRVINVHEQNNSLQNRDLNARVAGR